MRIEQIQQKVYAKIPDKVESEILKAINQYMTNVITTGNALDREALIREVILRIYPVVNKLATDISKLEVQKAIENLLDTLNSSGSITGDFNKKIISFYKVIQENDSKSSVLLNSETLIDLRYIQMNVKVNGQIQNLNRNYIYIFDNNIPTKILGINFEEEVFSDGDDIVIEVLIGSKDQFSEINL